MTTTTDTPPPLRRLLKYARVYRTRMIWAVICSILNKIFDLAPPILIGAAVDIVVNQEDSILASYGFPEVSTQLWILAGATLITARTTTRNPPTSSRGRRI